MIPDAPPALAVLLQRKEFLNIAQNGKKWVTPGLIVQMGPARKTDDFPPLRYGLTASSKIGNAVIRNRARRRMRALAQEILPLHAKPGHDYVLIARVTTVSRPFKDIRQDFMLALWKLKEGHGQTK